MKNVRLACLSWLALSGVTRGEELIAIVDLKYLKETEQVVATMCIGEECFPWAHGYLFEARVRKVINGDLPEGANQAKFLVLYGHHAMRTADVRGVVAKLRKLTDGIDGAQYQIADTGTDGGKYCFRWYSSDDEAPAENHGGQLLRCFYPDEYRRPEPANTAPVNPEELLRIARQEYYEALIDGDVVALERLFAEEFVYTTTSGEMLDKAAQLELIKSGALDIESGTGSEEKIQTHGAVGIVTGRLDARGKYAGQPFDSTERYTSVWIKRDDRWQLVAEQGTLVRK